MVHTHVMLPRIVGRGFAKPKKVIGRLQYVNVGHQAGEGIVDAFKNALTGFKEGLRGHVIKPSNNDSLRDTAKNYVQDRKNHLQGMVRGRLGNLANVVQEKAQDLINSGSEALASKANDISRAVHDRLDNLKTKVENTNLKDKIKQLTGQGLKRRKMKGKGIKIMH